MKIGDYIDFYAATKDNNLNPKGAKVINVRDYNGAYPEFFNAFITLEYKRRNGDLAKTETVYKIQGKPHRDYLMEEIQKWLDKKEYDFRDKFDFSELNIIVDNTKIQKIKDLFPELELEVVYDGFYNDQKKTKNSRIHLRR